ncbi:MAG: MGMT family protein [Candidatus Dormibacteria bacterium]|jgi:DNA-3-methyladenine glycosylase II
MAIRPPGHRQVPLDRAARIVERIQAIPRGSVSTYGDIEPGAPRLVGLLLSTTQVKLPWHRVVRADGSAPVGASQLERLRREGVPLRGDRVDLRLARFPRPGLDGREPTAEIAGGRQVSHLRAARILAARDPVIAELVAGAGPPRLRPAHASHFAALVRSIVYQQLAGAAAAAIHGRLTAALGEDVRPETLLSLPDDALRAAGLSANKTASLRDLAAKVLDGTVALSPSELRAEPDDEVVSRLSTVRGVGRWTAEMFLIFQLRRLDVWPAGDLGVRHGYALAWRVAQPSSRELEPLGEPFRPYRSVVAWYCWRAVELYGRGRESALTR